MVSLLMLYILGVLVVVKVTTSQGEVKRINYCNETVNSMKKMLDMASQTIPESVDPSYMLCVELSGSEELEYSNMTVPFSMVVRPEAGVDRGTLTCEREDLPLSNYEEFPLIIEGSDFVVIENIDFVGCRRPVQLMQIKNVQIINTTFR